MRQVMCLMVVAMLSAIPETVSAQNLSIEGEVCAGVDKPTLDALLKLELSGFPGDVDAYVFACRDETTLLLDGDRVVALEPPAGITIERERAIALTASEYIRWKKVPTFATEVETNASEQANSKVQTTPPSPDQNPAPTTDSLPQADLDDGAFRVHLAVTGPRLPLDSFWLGAQLGLRYVVDLDLELRYGTADSPIGRGHVLSAVIAVGWQGPGIALADEDGRRSFALHLSPSLAAGGVVGFGTPTGDGISSQTGGAVQLEARLSLVFSQWFADVELEVELTGGFGSGLSLLADDAPLLSTTGPFFEMGVGSRF